MNEYLGAVVKAIFGSGGDILNFGGTVLIDDIDIKFPNRPVKDRGYKTARVFGIPHEWKKKQRKAELPPLKLQTCYVSMTKKKKKGESHILTLNKDITKKKK